MLQNRSLSCGNSKFCFDDCRFSFILSVDLSLQSVYIVNLNHFVLWQHISGPVHILDF